MKQSWIIILILLFNIHCGFGQFRPSVIKKGKITPPVKFEDCFLQLDTILNDSFILEVKNLPIDIAPVKLNYNIGSFLHDKWKINYYRGLDGELTYSKNNPEFLQHYFDNGIYEPYIILRIIFRCYHNHLNNEPVNITDAFDYYQNIPGLRSLEISNNQESFYIRDVIIDYEDRLIDNYQLTFFNLGDTLGFSIWNKGCGTNCLLTGKVIDIDAENHNAGIYIFDIACSNRNTVVCHDSDFIELYDTVAYDLKECFKLNYKYPTYITGNPFMWNRYVNEKYSK